MAKSDHSSNPFSLYTVPEAEEAHLLDSQTTDGKYPLSGGLLSSSIFHQNGHSSVPSGAAIDLSIPNDAAHNRTTSHAETSQTYEGDPLDISVRGIMDCMPLARIPVGSKSSPPATPSSNHEILSVPESRFSSRRRADTAAASIPPNPDQQPITPLQSPLSATVLAAPKHTPAMPWDDPPKSSSPWHDALDEETGDIGRGPPRNGDSRIQPAPLGPVRGQSPSGQRDNYLAEDPDHLDDEEILHKRFSESP